MDNIDNYNNLVVEWNENYGHLCKGMTVSRDIGEKNLKQRVKTRLLSEKFTEREKVKHTITVIGDHSRIEENIENNRGGLSKGELSYMIVSSGKSLLSKY